MLFDKDLLIIRKTFGYTQADLACAINFPLLSIIRWEKKLSEPNIENINKIYSFAFLKGLSINKVYEDFYQEFIDDKKEKILFHGCKTVIKNSLDLNYSKKNNDFGIGFYLGETFKQSAMYVSNSKSKNIYFYKLNLIDLKTTTFKVDTEWMIAISYFRGQLNNYKNSKYIQNLVNKINNIDIIIAPIADNRMFDIISEFVRGEITDEQCKYLLASTDLGMQYVIKTNKGLNKLTLLKESLLCDEERKQYLSEKEKININVQNKLRNIRIQYRGKGRYIDEILK